jgi:serine protease
VRARGILIIAASGNNGFNRVLSPAAANGVLAVGAHNRSFTRACFSNYGNSGANGPGGIDILAPGGEANGSEVSCSIQRWQRQSVLSTMPNNHYQGATGTSMAAPMVAGVAALILSHNPGLTVSQLESRLLSTAYFDAGTMNTSEYGAGILRADLALGLPGPGDSLSVAAQGPSTAQATAVLDLYGSSTSYALENLMAGEYQLSAGSRASLYGERAVSLSGGDALTDQDISLEVAR